MKLFKAIVFWALIAFSIGFLWREIKQNPHDSLWNGAIVVPVVLFSLLFVNGFSGARKRAAIIMVESALLAVLIAAIATWKFLLLGSGYGVKVTSLIEGVAAGILFVACVGISLWSFSRLRKLPMVKSRANG
jgi:hypothetical protein